jgi:hypothetical protein
MNYELSKVRGNGIERRNTMFLLPKVKDAPVIVVETDVGVHWKCGGDSRDCCRKVEDGFGRLLDAESNASQMRWTPNAMYRGFHQL